MTTLDIGPVVMLHVSGLGHRMSPSFLFFLPTTGFEVMMSETYPIIQSPGKASFSGEYPPYMHLRIGCTRFNTIQQVQLVSNGWTGVSDDYVLPRLL